ncbi:hypothetical protein [Spiroplasma endosymbiont of Lariophagus distinguendus]|uniref:hypothetical protein n=1 Tax=Spiroplasma endosymbiont of Lariophagus distinguendus TaxID=2935082 RepID=UPI00207A7DD8|nr:hypothetical protein [Spiroplasma endosymbiont of Lariophagus distinguendus]
MNTEKILELVNSEEINDWMNLFKQKIEKEEIKNSEYMELYNKNYNLNYNFEFLEEEKILNILEELDKKIRKKVNSKNQIAKKYQKATEKRNEKLMEKYENIMKEKKKKIKALNLIKEEHLEKVKDLELKRCELLKNNDKNEIFLSKEDREIRNLENKIWKKVLDDYFQDKNHRILKLNQYENWFGEFKIKSLKIQIEDTIFEKRLKTLSDIVKTLYHDVSRDKLFLERENIKTDGFEEISLNSFDDEGIGESINSIDLQNQPSISGYKPSSSQM